jgi:hypothetical protein
MKEIVVIITYDNKEHTEEYLLYQLGKIDAIKSFKVEGEVVAHEE